MTTLETAYAQLAALERMSVDLRQRGSALLRGDQQEMDRLRDVVRAGERAAAKSREGAK